MFSRFVNSVLFSAILFLTVIAVPQLTVNAAPSIECGSLIQGQFGIGDSTPQEYNVSLNQSDLVVVISEVLDKHTDMDLAIAMYAPNGNQVIDARWGKALKASTDTLDTTGTYLLTIKPGGSNGGKYSVSISCIKPDGYVMSKATYVASVSCGSIISNDFSNNLSHSYYIKLLSETALNSSVEVLDKHTDMDLAIAMYAPNGNEIIDDRWGRVLKDSTDTLDDTGIYLITIMPGGSNGGKYSLSLGCTLPNGTVISPGDDPLPVKPIVTAVTATPVALLCTGSPATRLALGEKGRVTPGDPNNIRSDPDGIIVGKIPAGGEFDVVGGPVCGPKNRLYWQVNYKGVIGWTAEGEGTTYWLEPIASGRG